MKTERRLITIATRDENLKKINAELEKLDDEQLEQIAGGDKSDKEIITPEDLGIPPLVTVPIPKIKIGDIKIDFPKSKKKQELPEYLIIKK